MTAIETLERAISKLETLWEESPGEYDEQGFEYVFHADGTSQDAALLIALSRTVEPMLALLRKGRASMRGTEALGNPHPHTPLQKHALATALAILGEENDHDR